MKRLSWIATLPLTVIVVVFAVTNRQTIVLDLWPLEQSISVPLFVAILGGLFVGVLAGGTGAWLAGGRARRRARQAQRQAAELERESARLRRALEQAREARPPDAPGRDGLPAAGEGARRQGPGSSLTALGA